MYQNLTAKSIEIFRAFQQLRYRHETVAASPQPFDDERRRRDVFPARAEDAVVRQDDAPRPDALQDAPRHGLRCRSVVMVGGDRPEDRAITLRRGGADNGAVHQPPRRTEEVGAPPADLLDGLLTALQLCPHL